jgi:hypothetical protein
LIYIMGGAAPHPLPSTLLALAGKPLPHLEAAKPSCEKHKLDQFLHHIGFAASKRCQ